MKRPSRAPTLGTLIYLMHKVLLPRVPPLLVRFLALLLRLSLVSLFLSLSPSLSLYLSLSLSLSLSIYLSLSLSCSIYRSLSPALYLSPLLSRDLALFISVLDYPGRGSGHG